MLLVPLAFAGAPALAEETGTDLVAVSFQTLDARPVIHEPVSFRLVVQNAGDVRVDHCGFRLLFEENDTYAASGPCPLEPHTSGFIDFVWQPTRIGLHELVIAVHESPGETNRSNNRRPLTIDVLPASPLKLDQGYIDVGRTVENNTTTDRLWAVIDGVADHIPRHLHATFYENATIIGTAEAHNDRWSQANWYDKQTDTYGITDFLELNYRHDGTGPTNYTAKVVVDAGAAWSSRFTLWMSPSSKEVVGHEQGATGPDVPPRGRDSMEEEASTPRVRLESAAEIGRIDGPSRIMFVIQIHANGGDAPGTRIAVIDSAGYFVDVDSPRDITAGETATFTVRVHDDPDRWNGPIIVRAVSGESQSEPIFLEADVPAGSLVDRVAQLAAGPAGTMVLATGGGLLVFVAFLTTWVNEARRYLFLRRILQAGLGIGLFSRIQGDKALEHRTRDEIHRLVSERPGIHYREILRTLGLSNGRLAHHLQTLEREGLLRSERDGRLVRFYQVGEKARAGTPVTERQRRLLDEVRIRPGITPSELAARLGISRQGLHQQLGPLRDAGIIGATPRGRSMVLHLSGRLEERLVHCAACASLFDRGDDAGARSVCPSCGTT